LFLLPLAGAFTAWAYGRYGKNAGGGNNLLLETIHRPGGGVPRRMAPFVLAGTLITHLFGGSAGREGTAVQMGGALAAAYAKLLRFAPEAVGTLLVAGVAAGFGAVFGTPLAGAVFAVEVLALGRPHPRDFLPALAASYTGDAVCRALGAHHTAYRIAPGPGDFSPALFLKIALAGIAFGLAGRLFAETTHRLGDLLKKIPAGPPVRAAIGGLLVIGLVYLAGTRDYLGLGVSNPDPHGVSILSAFRDGGAHPWSWLWKLVFTAITLAAGFKGGEVTPLFFVGATLGNTLATLTGAPTDLFAGLGFLAVFAGAANTPVACAIMGAELFGPHYAVHFFLVCLIAYRCSGHGGIYHAQRIHRAKYPWAGDVKGKSLADLR